MSVLTFPATWRMPLPRVAEQNPVVCGDRVVVTDGATLHAFDRDDGTAAWSISRNGSIEPVIGVNDGWIFATSEPEGVRVEKIGRDGKILWALDGRWDLWPYGLVGAGDKFVLSGKRRDTDDSRLWEMSARDGAVLRSMRGTSRPGIVAIDGGWAWTDGNIEQTYVHAWDDAGERIVATAEVRTLGWARGLLFADGDGVLRAFDRNGAVWERPGGKTQQLATGEHGVACAYADDEGLWIWVYGFDGAPRWKSGPFRSGYPTLVWWGDLLIASGLTIGGSNAVALLSAGDGHVIHLELGGWTGVQGTVEIEHDTVFAATMRTVTRRERRTWSRIEDAWDPCYLVAVAAQLALGGGPDQEVTDRLDAELDALRANGGNVSPLIRDVRLPEADVAPLRDAVAAYRDAGRRSYDPLAHAVAWLFCDADWPLWAFDLSVEDGPERRVELMMFDSESDQPHWHQRDRIAMYLQLRYLSLRGNALIESVGIDLAALPRLAYLNLSENDLERVPQELKQCLTLVRLSLRSNALSSLDPADLPRTLRWLDVGQNQLPDEAVARLKAALPGCQVISYAQHP